MEEISMAGTGVTFEAPSPDDHDLAPASRIWAHDGAGVRRALQVLAEPRLYRPGSQGKRRPPITIEYGAGRLQLTVGETPADLDSTDVQCLLRALIGQAFQMYGGFLPEPEGKEQR